MKRSRCGWVPMMATMALGAGCASEKEQVTWDNVGGGSNREEAAEDPEKIAKEHFTDDACLADAETRLDTDRGFAKALALACLKRKDFMLLSKLAEPPWDLDLDRTQWDDALAASCRANSPDAVDLRPLGLEAPPLPAVEGEVPASQLHYVVALVTGVGPSEIKIKPIVYGATDKTTSKTEYYDYYSKRTGALVASNVAETTTKKTGNTRVAQVLDEVYVVEIPPDRDFKKDERYVMLVDRVKPGTTSDLRAHLVASSAVNPD